MGGPNPQDYRKSHMAYDAVVLDISGAVTDLNVMETTDLFDNIHVARELTLRTTKRIDVKFNDSANKPIPLLKTEGIDIDDGFPVTNVFITTTSEGGWVRIWIKGYN